MATPGHYKELTEGYNITKRADGVTATRMFHDGDASASDDLPDLGDRFSTDPTSAYYNCRVDQINIVKWGKHPDKQLYTIQYSTTPGVSDGVGDDDGTTQNPDFIPITGSLAGEAISIDGTKSASKWIWVDDGKAMQQQVFKKIMTGSFKVTKRLANLYLGAWAQYAGKINSTTFKVANNSYSAGLVLFNGVAWEEYKNNKGLRRWKVDFSFSVKVQPQGSSYYGWTHIYDERTNKFRQVKDSTNNRLLYDSADLNLLLAVPEET